MSDIEPTTLQEWYEHLKEIADSKDLGWLITDCESYRDYFEEGATPQEALDDEIQAAQDMQ